MLILSKSLPSLHCHRLFASEQLEMEFMFEPTAAQSLQALIKFEEDIGDRVAALLQDSTITRKDLMEALDNANTLFLVLVVKLQLLLMWDNFRIHYGVKEAQKAMKAGQIKRYSRADPEKIWLEDMKDASVQHLKDVVLSEAKKAAAMRRSFRIRHEEGKAHVRAWREEQESEEESEEE